MYNLKSTVHSFNEYITAVQNDDHLPLFYASDRSGQIKIGTVIKEKIEFVGGILAHSQQINAICKLNVSPRRGLFATGSSDKSIKLWRPSGQTLEHILNDFWIIPLNYLVKVFIQLNNSFLIYNLLSFINFHEINFYTRLLNYKRIFTISS